ncbi:MAG: rhomboid family intramembrane serine protease [Deltaproteobacteria bacterium]|nr:rhomboid family intramembrane serine protease [Deltaproteobacteria bacterium]
MVNLCGHTHRAASLQAEVGILCDSIDRGPWNHYFLCLMNNPDRLIKAIIYLNAGMYIISVLLSPRGPNFSRNPLTFLSPGSQSLLVFGATGTIPIDQLNRWWTLLTANYLHGGILHLLFNMLAFRQIAPLITHEYNISRMFIIYTLGGIAGFGISYLAGVEFTIGSSAAVCSLIGAALYFGKSRGGEYGHAVYRQVSGWVIGIFVFGFLIPGINNWGHAGGMLAGALLGVLLGYREKKREAGWHRLAARVLAAITLIVVFYAVVSGWLRQF